MMSGHPGFFELTQHFSRYFQTLLNPIHHHCHRVQIVLKPTFGAVFGMGNIVTDMS